VIRKYGTGFIIALDVDEKFLDVESHSLMLVNRQKGTSLSHFLRNPTFGVTYTTEKLFSQPQAIGSGIDDLEFLASPRRGWLDLLASIQYVIPFLAYCTDILCH